jgi:RNA polymerase sigma-70 factor, ECF subfamily
MAQNAPADWDRTVQRRLADGEAAALGESYDQFASLVHGLALRVLAEDSAADRITSEVFARLWQHPEDYDPSRGPLRAWLAELTHRLAVQRLCTPRSDQAPGGTPDVEHTVREASVAARADHLMASMPAHLRAALELAYFRRCDCRQAAAELGITEAETRDRLRVGLRRMAMAYDASPLDPPVGESAAPSEPAPPPGPGRPM